MYDFDGYVLFGRNLSLSALLLALWPLLHNLGLDFKFLYFCQIIDCGVYPGDNTFHVILSFGTAKTSMGTLYAFGASPLCLPTREKPMT